MIPATPFRAYKATDIDKTGYAGFLFEEGKTYTNPHKLKLCGNGYHFCLNPLATLSYYTEETDLLWEVEILGDVVGDPNDKLCTNKIKMIRILGEEERNQKLSGSIVTFYENGNKKEEYSYKDGKLDGLYSRWYPNGQKLEEYNYKDGKIDGLHTTWFRNGLKLEESTYKDGRRDGPLTSWYENGQKCVECIYKDGEEDGLYIRWYENGQKWKECTYKDGEEDGLYIRWYENGQKLEEST